MGRLLVFFFALTLLATSCAIQVPPSGGTKDTIPPVVRKFDPENFSTGFHGHDITIVFNEYMELKDLPSQLIVSPPLKYDPETNLSKKTLEIHLDDTLLPNTTYTMNFGNSITDLREGNALEDFQYVFSTGDIIDSLKVSGRVQNAFDNKTEKGIYVMLYKNMEDSIPLKFPPDYFTKTNEDGNFVIKNISPGDYRIFALKDNNTNYLFDNNEENIAFSDAMIEAGTSANSLRLFREERAQQLLKVSNEEPGHVTIAYAQPLENEKLIFLSDTSLLKINSITYSARRDTITLWYKNAQADSLILLVQHDSITDTIAPRLRHLETYVRGRGSSVSLKTQYESGSTYTLNLNRPLEIIFNHPIDHFDFSKVVVSEDSLPIKDVTYRFTDSLKRFLEIEFKRKEKTNYKVLIPKGSFTDIIGLENDSLEISFTTRSISDYGTLEIKMSVATGKNYIVQLIDDKEVIYRQTVFHSDSSIFYNYLDPRTYRLKLIEDTNGNGEWDTGNYLRHVQPEQIFYYKEDLTVRANWDVESKWNVE
jgi:uncharacterized protein (DUF2141 family)